MKKPKKPICNFFRHPFKYVIEWTQVKYFEKVLLLLSIVMVVFQFSSTYVHSKFLQFTEHDDRVVVSQIWNDVAVTRQSFIMMLCFGRCLHIILLSVMQNIEQCMHNF